MATYRQHKTEPSIASGDVASDTIKTIFENVRRTVTGVFVGSATPDLILQLLLNSQPLIDIDCSEFDATHGMLDVNIAYDVNIDIQYNLINNTSGTLTDVPINIRYDV